MSLWPSFLCPSSQKHSRSSTLMNLQSFQSKNWHVAVVSTSTFQRISTITIVMTLKTSASQSKFTSEQSLFLKKNIHIYCHWKKKNMSPLGETWIKTNLKSNLTRCHGYHGPLSPVVKSPVAQLRQLISASHKNSTAYKFCHFTFNLLHNGHIILIRIEKSYLTWGDSDHGPFPPVVKAVAQFNNTLSTIHKNPTI